MRLRALLLLAFPVLLIRAAPAATLRIMQPEPPRAMDPADQTATYTASVLDPIYETLVRLEPDGRIVPWLATGWTSSPDGLDWRFTIRPGIRFHDGSPCDAASVAASLGRLISRTRGLAGAGSYRAIIAAVDSADGVVHVRLKQRYAGFLSLLGRVQAAIVSPKAEAAGSLDRVADGTGPYRFVRWASGEFVEEVRNEAYWGRKPAIGRLVWTWSPEASVMNMALRSGTIDVAVPFSPIFAQQLARDPALALDRGEGAAVFFVALNTRLPPLNDVRVRRALSLATDRAALVAGLLHGYGRPACAPMPPAEAGCGRDIPDTAFDPAQARRLLRDAGLPHGFTLAVAAQEQDGPLAEALQAMWARIGVRLQVRRLESGVWTEDAFAGPAEKAAAGTGAVIASWASPFAPDLQIRPLFDSEDMAPHGANLGFFQSADVDRAIREAAQDPDAAERAALYRDVIMAIGRLAPTLLLYTPSDLAAHARTVHGLALMPGGEIRVDGATMSEAP